MGVQITRSSVDEAAIFAVLLRTWGNVALGGTRGFIVIEETSSFRDLVYYESMECSWCLVVRARGSLVGSREQVAKWLLITFILILSML